MTNRDTAKKLPKRGAPHKTDQPRSEGIDIWSLGLNLSAPFESKANLWLRGDAVWKTSERVGIVNTQTYYPYAPSTLLSLVIHLAVLGWQFHEDSKSIVTEQEQSSFQQSLLETHQELITGFVKQFGLLKHGHYYEADRTDRFEENIEDWRTETTQFYKTVSTYACLVGAMKGERHERQRLREGLSRVKGLDLPLVTSESESKKAASMILAGLVTQGMSQIGLLMVSHCTTIPNQDGSRSWGPGNPEEFALSYQASSLIDIGYLHLMESLCRVGTHLPLKLCSECRIPFQATRKSLTCSAKCRKARERREKAEDQALMG